MTRRISSILVVPALLLVVPGCAGKSASPTTGVSPAEPSAAAPSSSEAPLLESTFAAPGLGFSIGKPRGWLVQENPDLVSNVRKYRFDDDEFRAILRRSGTNKPLVSFFRDDPTKVAGVIPTVHILAVPHEATDAASFRAMVEASFEQLRPSLRDLEVEQPLSPVRVDGAEALALSLRFSLPTPDGGTANLRSRTVAIPRGRSFVQVSFTSLAGEEGQAALFDALVESIVLDEPGAEAP